MKRLLPLLLLIAAITAGCDKCNETVSSPTPLPGPTTDGGDTPQDEHMRNDTRVDFRQVAGVSAFALPMQDENFIRGFISHVQNNGYNTIRVFGKTDGWHDNNETWLPPGPPMGGGAEQNLKRLLRVAAEHPNFWVEVVATATERDNHTESTQWAKKVANICRGYKNVFISAMNEPQMSNWTNSELNALMRILRASGRPVGVDQPAEGGSWKFPRDLIVDFRAMHPRRNPDPTLAELQNLAMLNGLTLLDETTCYVSDANLEPGMLNNSLFANNGNGTERDRKRVITQYMERVKKVRDVKWFFHSIDTIKCNTLDFWLPEYR